MHLEQYYQIKFRLFDEPSIAYSFGTGTAIKVPELSLSDLDVAIVFAASAAFSKLYGTLLPLRLV